ncbi:MAG: DNA-processing protein DprA [Luteolibacter sp.]
MNNAGGGVDPREDDLAARALLTRLTEPGDARVGRAVLEHGAPAAVHRVVASDQHWQAAHARLAGRDPGEVVQEDLARLAQVGGRLVVPGTPGWPTQLDDLGERAPIALWLRGGGDLRLIAATGLSIVGARDCTEYGEHVGAELAVGLVERGWSIVSGGAYGIDAAAHRGALAADGATIAVLACGVDVAYPRGHEALLRRIVAEGVVVSELAPGVTARRERFLVRNRVIAALTRGTIVVEAAARSGSLSTARAAADLGRFVMGVPGPVTSRASVGVHQLLKDGAQLVTSVDDVAEAVGRLGVNLAPELRGPVAPRDTLDPTARRVLDALPARGTVGAVELAREAGVPLGRATATLGLLELDGFVTREPGGWALTAKSR